MISHAGFIVVEEWLKGGGTYSGATVSPGFIESVGYLAKAAVANRFHQREHFLGYNGELSENAESHGLFINLRVVF